jgi:hypothetical protein
MNPGTPGWLLEYLEQSTDRMLDLSKEATRRLTTHPEHSLYRVLQPTGMLYGQAAGPSGRPEYTSLNTRSKMKLQLVDSLLGSSLLYRDQSIREAADLRLEVDSVLGHITRFYNNVFPEIAVSQKTWYGKQRTVHEVVERLLDRRVESTEEYRGNFWTFLFHNSLLFLDTFIFGQWLHTNAGRIVSDFLKFERDELRSAVVRVMAAAAHANRRIEAEERKLFELFLMSPRISSDNREESMRIFEQGIDVEEINLPSNNSWILKKYFLEMALLTVWSDKKEEVSESSFIERFVEYLEFSPEDLENSRIATEGFIIEHWEELNYLAEKKDYDDVVRKYAARLSRLATQHHSRLVNEIRSNPELMAVLRKGQSEELTETDEEKVRSGLIDVLRVIPTFVLTALPKRFLTLRALMKILPTNLISDSLREQAPGS